MYLTALMQVTCRGCEIHPTNPLMNNFNTYFFTLNEAEITFLTHYQTTNFKLFQTGRVCRRQFQI